VSQDEFNWRLGAGLLAMVFLAIALMLGFGFGLEWVAGRFA
jgi:hypothetical protein